MIFFYLLKVEHSNCTLIASHHLMTAGKAEKKFPGTALRPCVIPSGLCWWALQETHTIKITVLTQNHHRTIYKSTWTQFRWSISHGSSIKMSLDGTSGSEICQQTDTKYADRKDSRDSRKQETRWQRHLCRSNFFFLLMQLGICKAFHTRC